jgi:hypothetical protein
MLLFSASFFLAPELRRLARERRNGKQRQKASPVEAFLYLNWLVLFQAPDAWVDRVIRSNGE